jgi:hypothetical protein
MVETPALHKQELRYSYKSRSFSGPDGHFAKTRTTPASYAPYLEEKKHKFPYNPEHGKTTSHSVVCVRIELRHKVTFRFRLVGRGHGNTAVPDINVNNRVSAAEVVYRQKRQTDGQEC